MSGNLDFLSTRTGFNTALRHFKTVNSFIKSFKNEENLADLINNSLENKKLAQHQIGSILNALLVDKFGYLSKSFNLCKTYTKPLSEVAGVVGEWSAFDIVLSYFHPQLGRIVINPKNEESWNNIDSLRENELLVVYIGKFDKDVDYNESNKCFEVLKRLFNNEPYKVYESFKTGKEEVQEAKKEAVAEKKAEKKKVLAEPQKNKEDDDSSKGGKKKLSPHYGVLVSNELFHNGNVEAWKKIIKSYENKYSGINVLIFYEGEQIHDINTLFKWGKVKHGTNIYFALLGTDFKDISKLRRYLAQGASSRFEDFLRGDPTKVLTLF